MSAWRKSLHVDEYQRNPQLTPLFLACWAKKPEAALILLEEGADPNILALQVGCWSAIQIKMTNIAGSLIVSDVHWRRASGNVTFVRCRGSKDGRGGEKFKNPPKSFSGERRTLWERSRWFSENQFTPISPNLAEMGSWTKRIIETDEQKFCYLARKQVRIEIARHVRAR